MKLFKKVLLFTNQRYFSLLSQKLFNSQINFPMSKSTNRKALFSYFIHIEALATHSHQLPVINHFSDHFQFKIYLFSSHFFLDNANSTSTLERGKKSIFLFFRLCQRAGWSTAVVLAHIDWTPKI